MSCVGRNACQCVYACGHVNNYDGNVDTTQKENGETCTTTLFLRKSCLMSYCFVIGDNL